jgi:hypothetical protein
LSSNHDGNRGIDPGAGGDEANSEKSVEQGTEDEDSYTKKASMTADATKSNTEELGEGIDSDHTTMDVEGPQSKEGASKACLTEQSAEIEKEMDVEHSTTAEVATTSGAVDIPVPNWLSGMLLYLRDVSDVKAWQDLVTALIDFKKLDPPSGVCLFCFTHFLLVTNMNFGPETANHQLSN